MEEVSAKRHTRAAERRRSRRSPVPQKPDKRACLKQVWNILCKTERVRTPEERAVLLRMKAEVREVSTRLAKRRLAAERSRELTDEPSDLRDKCRMLANAVRNARHLVVYTGAGISTAADIPDYRGPDGIWTRIRAGKDVGEHDLTLAEPTYTHMALRELYRRQILKFVVSQNCDGLHLRSGLPRRALAEVHGNMYVEVCSECEPTVPYLRLFDTTERTARFAHWTARICHYCASPLRDTIVHFGERGEAEWPLNWAGALKHAEAADVIVCLGSSLKVLRRYPWLWAMDRPPSQRPELYIVNLQWTPKDDAAKLKIHGRCDDVIRLVMRCLGVPVPRYDRRTDPIFAHATPLSPRELHTTTRAMLTRQMLPSKPPLINSDSEDDRPLVQVQKEMRNHSTQGNAETCLNADWKVADTNGCVDSKKENTFNHSARIIKHETIYTNNFEKISNLALCNGNHQSVDANYVQNSKNVDVSVNFECKRECNGDSTENKNRISVETNNIQKKAELVETKLESEWEDRLNMIGDINGSSGVEMKVTDLVGLTKSKMNGLCQTNIKTKERIIEQSHNNEPVAKFSNRKLNGSFDWQIKNLLPQPCIEKVEINSRCSDILSSKNVVDYNKSEVNVTDELDWEAQIDALQKTKPITPSISTDPKSVKHNFEPEKLQSDVERKKLNRHLKLPKEAVESVMQTLHEVVALKDTEMQTLKANVDATKVETNATPDWQVKKESGGRMVMQTPHEAVAFRDTETKILKANVDATKVETNGTSDGQAKKENLGHMEIHEFSVCVRGIDPTDEAERAVSILLLREHARASVAAWWERIAAAVVRRARASCRSETKRLYSGLHSIVAPRPSDAYIQYEFALDAACMARHGRRLLAERAPACRYCHAHLSSRRCLFYPPHDVDSRKHRRVGRRLLLCDCCPKSDDATAEARDAGPGWYGKGYRKGRCRRR